ncbi:MAG: holo-ACP synthase [Halanaerobiales bacterium]
MITGIGLDIVEVKRIKNIINRWGDNFLNKVYTLSEIKYSQQYKNSYVHFAGRFAAKEAFSKMLGSGMNLISWKEIEVINDKKGKPDLNISGKAEKIITEKNIKNIHISISHEKEYAVAEVIGER